MRRRRPNGEVARFSENVPNGWTAAIFRLHRLSSRDTQDTQFEAEAS
jgi:hypothetical protein